MDVNDLFDFSNTNNILGNTTNVTATASASALSAQRSHSSLSDGGNNDVTEKKEEKKKKPVYRVVIVGDPQVGKTTFLAKHLNGSFDNQYRATIGASTFHLEFNTNLDSHKYEVLDVAGQNLFAGKRDKYYEGICGAIIMYDVMNWGSYDNVSDIWLKELNEKAPSGIPIVIVGNKMENRDTRKVSVEVVAEAISNKFEPEGIGYCEISVKTNQNLAEPFLFLTKRILNINDSKALYFVSKISELNLIESMLQHKKDKDDKQQKQIINEQQTSPKNLDNLFVNDSNIKNNDNNNNNNNNTKKGGDYLDDIIFKIGDDDTINNNDSKNKVSNKTESESKTQSISISNDDNFLAEMMSSNPSTITVSKPKSKSISPKTQNVNQQKRNRANSAKSAVKVTAAISNNLNNKNNKKNKKTAIISKPISSKHQQQQKKKVKHAVHVKHTINDNNNNNNNNGVVIDILLGIQETLNNLQSDVRRLQNDVNYLKQQRK